MAAAPEFPPVVYIPQRARARRRPAGSIVAFPTRAVLDEGATWSLTCVPAAAVPLPVATPALLLAARPESAKSDLATSVLATSVWATSVWATSVLATSESATSLAVAPVRLTRRGVRVVAAATVLVAAALVSVAWLSAPSSASPVSAGPPTTVVVHSGDSLWSIAQRVAPDGDPRATVARLERVNGLGDGAALQPGEVLRVR